MIETKSPEMLTATEPEKFSSKVLNYILESHHQKIVDIVDVLRDEDLDERAIVVINVGSDGDKRAILGKFGDELIGRNVRPVADKEITDDDVRFLIGHIDKADIQAELQSQGFSDASSKLDIEPKQVKLIVANFTELYVADASEVIATRVRESATL